MNIKVEQKEDKAVIIFEKTLSVGYDAAVVQNTVLDLIEAGNKTIVADLSNLDYITSWGIGILIYAFTTCTNRNVDFYLLDVKESILNILKKVKMDKIFKIL